MKVVLHSRSFALLWLGGLISNIGDWAVRSSLPFYVYARTSSTTASGTTLIVEAVPWVLFASIAGVLVDRWDRQRTLVLTNLVSGSILLVLLAGGAHPQLWSVYLVSFLITAAGQFAGPAGSALLPCIVGKEELLEANSLVSLSDSVGRIAGPALGGVLLGFLGLPGIVLVDGASFLVSAALVMLITVPETVVPNPEADPDRPDSLWAAFWWDWLEGVKIVRTTPVVATVFLVVGLVLFGSGGIGALLAPFLLSVLKLGAVQFGWMMAALGLGGVVGAVLIMHMGRTVGPRYRIAIGLVATGTLWLCIFQIHALPVILALLVLLGIPNMGWQVSLSTLIQGAVPTRYLGRVWGAYGALIALVTIGGTALASVSAAPLGVLPVLDIACAFYFCVGILSLLRFDS